MAKILGKEEESQSCGTSTLALHQSEHTGFLMDISQLPERDRQHVSRLLEEKQVCVASVFLLKHLFFKAQQFMSLYGGIVNGCFKDCINDFTSETLANSEVFSLMSLTGC